MCEWYFLNFKNSERGVSLLDGRTASQFDVASLNLQIVEYEIFLFWMFIDFNF